MLRAILLSASLLVSTAAGADWRALLESATQQLGTTPAPARGTAAPGALNIRLSDEQVIQGLKEALRVGAEKAIDLLGREGGYLNDVQVRIPLPATLDTLARGLRAMGQDALVDRFQLTMNRAAERAVPQTLSIFSDAIGRMSLEGAQGILNGGETAATDYFRRNSGAPLRAAILPIVRDATQEAGVTSAYKALAGEMGFLGGYVDSGSLDLDAFVTEKAVDGLFLKLAEEERLIRKDPVARTSNLLQAVFGGVRR
ncbi:MAG: DUF4197 domain-containing protein [Candidatus Sedimenticola endophacoides]